MELFSIIIIVNSVLLWSVGRADNEIFSKSSPIFYSNVYRRLAQTMRQAESGLKIYIYPVPDDAIRSTIPLEIGCAPHFNAEFQIPSFFRTNGFVTDNPNEANFFLITHNISCLHINWKSSKILAYFGNLSTNINSEWSMKYAAERHLGVIVRSVIHDFPFFNKSLGHDHLFITTFDNFPYETFLYKQWLDLLVNATCLMNFGIIPEKGYLISNYGIRDHDRDIVIPQYHHYTPFTNNVHIIRKYDSFFKGSYNNDGLVSHGIRPLLKMNSGEWHYISKGGGRPNIIKDFGDEKYRYFSTSDATSTDVVSDSYFCLCPAGMAPWSVRLYDAISHACIPVLLATGIKLPFERFLNWSTFVIKIDTDPFFVNPNATQSIRDQLLLSLHLKAGEKNKSGNGQTSYLYEKMNSVIEASRWLHWQYTNAEGVVNPRSIWRLLVLELWCHAAIYGNNKQNHYLNKVEANHDYLNVCLKYSKSPSTVSNWRY